MQAAELEVTSIGSGPSAIDRIRNFVQENFLYMHAGYDLQDEDKLLEKGIVDSMGIAELIAFVEDEFHIHVDEPEISEANFGSLASISAYVAGKRGVKFGG